MPGAEARRLDAWSATPEQRQCIHFYVDEGRGIKPETGVGDVPHDVRLNNLYDWNTDPLKLWDEAKARGPQSRDDLINYMEQAIIGAGFDGVYATKAQGEQGVAVLLGKHEVPIKFQHKTESGSVTGQDGKANKAVKLLNQGMAKYLNDSAWENAYVTGELHDNLSAIGQAIEVGFGAKVFPIRPTAKRFDVFNGVHYAGNIYVNSQADVGFINVARQEIFHLRAVVTEVSGDFAR